MVDPVDVTNRELWELYNIRNSAYLNMLYYGRRAVTWASWNLRLQVGAAVGSLGAVGAFLAVGQQDPIWKWLPPLVGACSAIAAALPPIMGHSEKINKFEKLHFAHCELFELAKRTTVEIRRVGLISEEQIGAAKLLSDLGSRFGRMDDTEHDRELKDECEIIVRERFPAASLWYADVNVGTIQAPGQATSTTTHP